MNNAGYFAEIPAVIFDVQRAGPSTGMSMRTQQSDVLAVPYASRGDTKHVLLPEYPRACFDFGATALDLADRLQTTIFVLLNFDIGMNDLLCESCAWDDAKRMDRGKVMTVGMLEATPTFGRYRDVDGDEVPYRTYPGTHRSKGAFLNRGTSRDRFAKYNEQGPAYVHNMQRLLRKFETAKELVPSPIERKASRTTPYSVISYGSTSAAMRGALAGLEQDGIHLDAMRLRAFPFHDDVSRFVEAHETVFVAEQNRDAQLRTLIMNEYGFDPARLVPILHYDGTPITASMRPAR
jgi:2-oxoglutarate ferredoxin oxidoreductase subunit alpha